MTSAARQRFDSRFRERLALLHRHDRRDRFGALAQQLGRAAHQIAALDRGHLAPDPETACGRLHGFGEVGFAGERDRADLGLGCRIDNG